jgi:hypothetical protein
MSWRHATAPLSTVTAATTPDAATPIIRSPAATKFVGDVESRPHVSLPAVHVWLPS